MKSGGKNVKCKYCNAEWKAGSNTRALESCPFCGKRIDSNDYYLQGIAYNKASNRDEWLSCTEVAAELGHTEAQFTLGTWYDTHWTNGDYSKAEYWYSQAASKGHTEAQFKLGELHTNTDWPGRDSSKAEYWYYQAASKGHKEAQFKLGELYQSGRDYSKAEYWYHQAAIKEHKDAQYQLGQLYDNDNWSGHDYSSAEYWLIKSVSAYSDTSNPFYGMRLYSLGFYYRRHRNYTEAIKWFLKATQTGGKGSKLATQNLQEMAIEGHTGAIIALDQIKNRGFSLNRAWNNIWN